jgi:hypothetical protein
MVFFVRLDDSLFDPKVEQKRAGRWSGKASAVAFALGFSPLKIVQQNSSATAIVAHLPALLRV